MLCVTFILTIYLGFRLGTSSEYRDFAPGAAEQLAAMHNAEDKLPVDERTSQEDATVRG